MALLTGEILAGEGLAGGLATVLVMTVIMTVLVRLAGIDWHWRREIKKPWIFLGAAVFVIVFLVLVNLDPFPPGRRTSCSARPRRSPGSRWRWPRSCSPSCSS